MLEHVRNHEGRMSYLMVRVVSAKRQTGPRAFKFIQLSYLLEHVRTKS